ncbi:biogenesis of lysosome-related organelles complex 1 subunit 4-like [Megalops cyprinoides]|uniref:biogenesis of lysosome-related organelles complex 1 subunit 4-like n=1 Tax=Megalops cyprinoides TaxID=118141 RepID=UPI001864A712|nr:biogenesis of lysosome-related organelles complex 1 subunit 4-like [Megalops cyprinoides]
MSIMEPAWKKHKPADSGNTQSCVFRDGHIKSGASPDEGQAKELRALGVSEEQLVNDLKENNAEVWAFQDSMDEMLSRLDEFCDVLDAFRSLSSELLSYQVPLILAKAAEMRSIYTRIDKFEAFVQMVGGCVSTLELQVQQVEREQKRFPRMLHGMLQPSQKISPDHQKEEMQHPFELPTLFRTEECFPQKSQET